MDNVGIVVQDLDAAIEFFTELGLTLEGRMPIEGAWAGRVTGVRGQRVEIAMLRTPDGHSRLELSRFVAPAIASDHRAAPVNSLGYLRVMFAVDDLDDTLARLSKLGARVVDEVVDYEGPVLHPRSRGNSHRARATARAAELPRESSGAKATMTASAPLNLGLFRVHRIFSCAFFGLALVVIGAGVSILLQGQDAGGVVFYGVFLLGFSVAHWYAGNGARDGKNYGRFLSRMFGMLWLIGFPITTVLGIYVLIRAGSSWTKRAVPLDEAQ